MPENELHCRSCGGTRWSTGSLLSLLEPVRLIPSSEPWPSKGYAVMANVCLDCGHLDLAIASADAKKIKPPTGSVLGLT